MNINHIHYAKNETLAQEIKQAEKELANGDDTRIRALVMSFSGDKTALAAIDQSVSRVEQQLHDAHVLEVLNSQTFDMW